MRWFGGRTKEPKSTLHRRGGLTPASPAQRLSGNWRCWRGLRGGRLSIPTAPSSARGRERLRREKSIPVAMDWAGEGQAPGHSSTAPPETSFICELDREHWQGAWWPGAITGMGCARGTQREVLGRPRSCDPTGRTQQAEATPGLGALGQLQQQLWAHWPFR